MAPTFSSPRAAFGALLAVIAALLIAPTAPAADAGEIADAVTGAQQWLLDRQTPSGAFGEGFGADYAPGAIAASGLHLADVRRGGATAQDYVRSAYTGPTWTTPPLPSSGFVNAGSRSLGNFTWAILTLHAAGIDPQRIAADQNHVAQLAAAYRRDGAVGPGGSNFTAFSLLALGRARSPQLIRDQLAGYLRSQQTSEGSWSIATITDANRSTSGGAEVTGAVLAALCESGAPLNDPAVQRGFAYLQSRVLPNGGIGTSESNADTAAWVLNALNGCYPDGLAQAQTAAWTGSNGPNATLVDYLLSQQVKPGDPDGAQAGAFRSVNATADLYTTQNALRALAGETYSAEPPERVNPADPRLAPIVPPPAGTPGLHAVIVDYGGGLIEFCPASAPLGGPVESLLAALPDRCRPHPGDGQWRVAVESGALSELAGQPLAFGDTITFSRVAGTGTRGPVGDTPPPAPELPAAPAPGPPAPAAPAPGPLAPGPPSGQPAAPKTAPKLGRVHVRCKLNRARTRLACTARSKALRAAKPSKAKVTLTRRGRTYARGTLRKLKRTRRMPRGTYVLRIPSLGATAKVKLR